MIADDTITLTHLSDCGLAGCSVAWTRKYGKGRVFKTTLGHDGLAFRTPEFQRLILNGVDWVTAER